MEATISPSDPVLIAGAGGFIGGWLVRHLTEQGYTNLRAIDIKPVDEWYQVQPGVPSFASDLRSLEACNEAVQCAAPTVGFGHQRTDRYLTATIERGQKAALTRRRIHRRLMIQFRHDR